MVNDDLFMLKVISSENFSFQSYQNKGLIPWTKTQIQLMSDVLLDQPRKLESLYWEPTVPIYLLYLMSFIGQRADIQIISYLGEETVDILLHMTSFSVKSFFSEIFLDLFSKLLIFIKIFLIQFPMIIWKIEEKGLQKILFLF